MLSIRELLLQQAKLPHRKGRENKRTTAAQNTVDVLTMECRTCLHECKNFYIEEPCKTCTDSVNPEMKWEPKWTR